MVNIAKAKAKKEKVNTERLAKFFRKKFEKSKLKMQAKEKKKLE